MERRFKVNDSASGDASAKEVKTKEAALEKLRKMEWKRNTQDTWHLARSSSRSTDVQERKKYNKDEDNYFEGTGVQKTKKLRKPRLSESSPTVPPGFSTSHVSTAPPQVNAWAQKKGSALFQREDEIDEEDQLLKLVLQESLKSAEDDKKRRMERYEMTNLDLPTSTEKKSAEDEDWVEEDGKEEVYTKPNPIGIQDNSPKADLQFIDTDLKEESPTVNQRCRFIQPKARKNPREKSSSFVNNNYDFQETEKKVVSPAVSKSICSKQSIEGSSGTTGNKTDNDDCFELARPQTQTKYSKPIDKGYKAIKSLPSHPNHSSNTPTLHRSSVKHTVINSEDLSSSLNSPLTFGKTQGLYDKIQDNNENKQSVGTQNGKNETPSYLTEISNANAQIKSPNPCEPSETDIFLHNFIRCDPPPDTNSLVQSNVSVVSAVEQSNPDHLFSPPTSHSYPCQDLNSPQFYTTNQIVDTEQHPVMNGLVGSALPGGIHISNGRDSGSSVSGSPLQTMTPYGSLENEGPSNARVAASQIRNVPYPYPYSAETNQESLSRQLQAMQLMNQNLLPGNMGANVINVEYPSVPTPIAGVIPVNSQVGQPQYRLPNSNMILPSFPGQTMSPLLLQHQLQQAHIQRMQVASGYLPHMMGLNALQPQQSQLGAGVAESEDGSKEQGNINQSHMPNSHQITQNQAQIVTQNQPHVLQLQNHPQILSMQNQAQAIPLVEHTMPKQEELQQQLHKQGGMPRSGGKTKEELQMEYQIAIQALRRVEEKIQEQAAQDVAAGHGQPPWGIISQSPPMPLALNQFFPVHQVHSHMFQQSQNPGLISPTVQHTPQNLTGSMNVSPEMNVDTAQNPARASPELKIGRGRGRMY